MKIEITANLTDENMKQIALECAKIMQSEVKDAEVVEVTTYTTTQVANMLNKSQSTIQRHCESGLLEASKPSKSWIITKENLDKYLKQNNEL